MRPANFKFCPRCGSIGYQYRENKYWYCPVCLSTHFQNVAASASIIAEICGSILLLVRNRDPGRGMLSLPGGFVDAGERAEDAAVRECREETGLEAFDLSYVGSWPNEYTYKNVVYSTCDIYFSARLTGLPETGKLDENEVSAFKLIPPENIASSPIAFDSHRKAILAYLDKKTAM